MSGSNRELKELQQERAAQRAAAIAKLAMFGVTLDAEAQPHSIRKAIKALTGKDSDAYDLMRGLVSGRYRPKLTATDPNAEPTRARLIQATGRPLATSPAMRLAAERARAAEPALRGWGCTVRLALNPEVS